MASKFSRSRILAAGTSLLFVLLSLIYGGLRLDPARVQFGGVRFSSGQNLKLLLVQPDFNPEKEFGKESVLSNIYRQRALTSQAIESRGLPDLVIWPETSVGFNYYTHETSLERGSARDPFPGLVVPLLFGGQRQLREHGSDGKVLFHNSAMLLDVLGRFIGVYNKRRLFPLSETLPLASWLPILNELNSAPVRLEPGSDEQPHMLLFLKQHSALPVRMAVAICYEDMSPSSYHSYFKGDAPDILIAITNDTWFLDSIALRQHHALAALRAIEFRRYLVRASVDGLSAVVDPVGRTAEAIPTGEAGWLFSVASRAMSGKTFYARVGYRLISYLGLGLSLFACLANLFLRDRHDRSSPAAIPQS